MLIEATAAKPEVDRVKSALVESHKLVVDRWFEMVSTVPQYVKPVGPTTRAGWIHDHVCPEIEARIEELKGVTAHEQLGFFALTIDSDILMRFKYVGHGAPSNVATDQQKALARQEYDDQMLAALGSDPAFQPPTLLTCGYTLGDGELGRLEIRCDYKGKVHWSFDLFGGDAVSAPVEFPDMPPLARPARVKSESSEAARAEAEEGEADAEEEV